MIRRLFVAAIAAGVLAGVIISAIHQVTTVPIIHEAETYENAARHKADAPGVITPAGFRFSNPVSPSQPSIRHVHGGGAEDAEGAWGPKDGLERILFTVMTTILTGVGFALLLVVGMMLRGEPVDARRGVLWGAGGFVAFTLAPTLGLPPEIPGAAAADLMARQIWWISAAVTAMAGLWLLVFTEGAIWKALGVAVFAAPHVFGAPHPHEFGVSVAPPELAAQFAATSIAISALFWAMLGGFAGHFFGRMEPAE
jgi:cobalt transporter subunit CbtA